MNYLVRMFDVNTEPQFFQHSSLTFDYLILEVDVVGIQDHWFNGLP